MPILLAHLPHLVLALAALGLAARVEVGPPGHRTTRVGVGLGAVVAAATVLIAVPVLRGGHPSEAAIGLYLAAGGLAGVRAGWVASRRLGRGGLTAVLAWVAVGLGVGLGYLVAGLAMTHGTLLAGS